MFLPIKKNIVLSSQSYTHFISLELNCSKFRGFICVNSVKIEITTKNTIEEEVWIKNRCYLGFYVYKCSFSRQRIYKYIIHYNDSCFWSIIFHSMAFAFISHTSWNSLKIGFAILIESFRNIGASSILSFSTVDNSPSP